MPQPENRSSDNRCLTSTAALSSSTMPVHRRWPTLDASAGPWRLSPSRATANHPADSTQKSRLKAALSSMALVRQAAAVASSPASAGEGAEGRAGEEGGGGVALALAHRQRPPGLGAVGEEDRGRRVLPRLVAPAPVGGPLVLDVAVPVAIA